MQAFHHSCLLYLQVVSSLLAPNGGNGNGGPASIPLPDEQATHLQIAAAWQVSPELMDELHHLKPVKRRLAASLSWALSNKASSLTLLAVSG